MKYILMFFLLLVIGCANKVEVPSTVEQHVSGQATVTTTIELGFLDQLTKLCTDEFGTTIYATSADHDKAVADCVFNHLSLLNVTPAQLSTFGSNYCKAGADLSSFTLDQQTQILSTCKALGL